MISDKICPQHLERKAILYVRQSSAHQVLHNRESSALQYAMRDRLTTLGWSEIEVIDDDLGRSAAGGGQRAGFERIVAQVCLGTKHQFPAIPLLQDLLSIIKVEAEMQEIFLLPLVLEQLDLELPILGQPYFREIRLLRLVMGRRLMVVMRLLMQLETKEV